MSRIKKLKEKVSIIQEFKEFALKGNMVDLAVGVVIGAAFNSILHSFLEDIIMPLLGLIIAGDKFSGFTYVFGNGQELRYGDFIQNVVNFFITALAVFIAVKIINKLRAPKEEEPAQPTEAELLTEIRDLMKEESQS